MSVVRGHRTHDFETIVGQFGIETRCHYWAIRIDSFGQETDIICGIVRKEVDNPINFSGEPISQNKNFYGFLPGTGARLSNQQPKNYITEIAQYGTEFGLLFK